MNPVIDNSQQAAPRSAAFPDSDQWHTAPPLSADMLEGTFWQLSDLEGRRLSPFVVLAPQGLVGNFNDPATDMWQVVNGSLCLIDINGLPSVIFTVARSEEGALVALAGRGTIGGVQAFYSLSVTNHPAHPLFATPSTVIRKANFLTRPQNGPLRPNLVVVPAGAQSLHPKWFEGITSMTRNWDLCIGYYGQETPQVASPYEYLAHIPATKKFRIIYDLMYEGSPLWDYEAIWFPDDDLLCDGNDVNRLFHVFRRHGLDLAQPSLRSGGGSYPNHPLTVQRPGSFLRYESFVEIMCPVFSSRALRICIDSMRDAESGYGLDHLWPSFLGRPRGRMAIIDAVAISHTRPIGATYNVKSAVDEQSVLFNAYWHRHTKVTGVW